MWCEPCWRGSRGPDPGEERGGAPGADEAREEADLREAVVAAGEEAPGLGRRVRGNGSDAG